MLGNYKELIMGQKLLEDYCINDTFVVINKTNSAIVYRMLETLDESIIDELASIGWKIYRGTENSSAEYLLDNYTSTELRSINWGK